MTNLGNVELNISGRTAEGAWPPLGLLAEAGGAEGGPGPARARARALMSKALGQSLLQQEEPGGIILRNEAEAAAEAARAEQGGAAPEPEEARAPVDPAFLRALQLGVDGPERWLSPALWDGLFIVGATCGAWMGVTIWQYFDPNLALVGGWQCAACLMTVQVCLSGSRIIRVSLGEQELVGQLLRGEASAACQAALKKVLMGCQVVQHAFNAATISAGLWILIVLYSGKPNCGIASMGCSVNMGEAVCTDGVCITPPDGTCSGTLDRFLLKFSCPNAACSC